MSGKNIYQIIEDVKTPQKSRGELLLEVFDDLVLSVGMCEHSFRIDPLKRSSQLFEEGDIVTYVGDAEDDLDRGNEYEIAQVDEDDSELPYALHDNEGGWTWVSADDIESID